MQGKVFYTCGNLKCVRGNCNIKHRTLKSSVDCRKKDQFFCKKIGGYSDRKSFRLINNIIYELTDDEFLYGEYLYSKGGK